MENKSKHSPFSFTRTPKHRFFQWCAKWFYGNIQEEVSSNIDLPSLICLMQAVGFKLQKFEKSDTNDELKNGTISISMHCGTSKMQAVLQMESVHCECPSEPDKGSMWSISGSGPSASTDSNKIEEKTGSNLLPDVSKEVSAVSRDVIYQIFKLINNKQDTNQNSDLDENSKFFSKKIDENTKIVNNVNGSPLRRSVTDLANNYKPTTITKPPQNLKDKKERPHIKRQSTFEIDETKSSETEIFTSNHVISSSSRESLAKLERQSTYDIDEPRDSLPSRFETSFFTAINSSAAHLTLDSDDEPLGLADCVVRAHQILEKAVNIIRDKIPPSSSTISLIDDSKFIKSKNPPGNISFKKSPTGESNYLANRSICSSIGTSSTSSRTGSSISRQLPPKPPAAVAKKPISRRTIGSSLSSSVFNTQKPVVSGIAKPIQSAAGTAKKRSLSNAGNQNTLAPKIPLPTRSQSLNDKKSTTPTNLNSSSIKQELNTSIKQELNTSTTIQSSLSNSIKQGLTNPIRSRMSLGNSSLSKIPSPSFSKPTTATLSSKFGFTGIKK